MLQSYAAQNCCSSKPYKIAPVDLAITAFEAVVLKSLLESRLSFA